MLAGKTFPAHTSGEVVFVSGPAAAPTVILQAVRTKLGRVPGPVEEGPRIQP